MHRATHYLRHALVLAITFAFSPFVSAQWVSESYPLKAGWNGIWLSQDCSIKADGSARTVNEVLFAAYPKILEVWRWNPLSSTVQFTQAPSAPINSDSSWTVWRRGDPDNSTLGTLTGNSAYLVNVATDTSTLTLSLTGRPLVPNYSFTSSGLNFIGFPMQSPDSTSLRNFETFFSFSEMLKTGPSVFYYNGGPLSDTNPKNPLQLITSQRASTSVSRNKAYWVKSAAYSDYYGPLKVTVLGSGGIEFGKKRNTVTVRVKNVTDPLKGRTVNATFTSAASVKAPGDSTAISAVPLRVRGERDANLQFTYTNLPALLSLAPGEEKDLVLAVDRQGFVANKLYQSILKVTDSLNHTRIDLPVSASATTTSGIWMGEAVLNAVNQVETLSGPEFDAPLGTPNGETAEIETIVTTTKTILGGMITQDNIADLDFDSAGNAYLNGPNVTGVSVDTLSSYVDQDFDPGMERPNSGGIYTFTMEPDGKIYVGGDFQSIGGQPRNELSRLNGDGTLDLGFNPPAFGSAIETVAVLTNGKVLVSGWFFSVGGVSSFARLNTDGTLDAAYDLQSDGPATKMVRQPDGKILLSGYFFTIGGRAQAGIARLNADGTLDTAFNSGTDYYCYDLALQPDGKIVVSGGFTNLGGQPRNYIGRLNADGSLDTSFNPGADGDVYDIALQSDGKILVSGEFSTIGGEPKSDFGRLNADGTLDTTFDPLVNGFITKSAVQADDKILVCGSFTILGGQPRNHIGRFNADGTLDLSFNPGVDGHVSTLALQPDGKILVAGDFTTLDGAPRGHLGRLNPGPLSFTPATEGAGQDYTVVSSNRAIVTSGGSGYTSAPTVALAGGGGSGAQATAALSAGVASVTMSVGGSGYSSTSPPTVTFSGDGSGAAGFAVIRDGLVTDVTVTNPGSGYSVAPTINFNGGSGSGAVATAKIVGGVGRVTITAGGSSYTSAPTVSFSGGEGFGAEALTTISGGVVTGVSAIQKEPDSAIIDSARVSYTSSTPAPDGAADGTTTTTSISTSKVVTLNGKSRVVTRRVSDGGGAAAPSNFPVRLILHAPATGAPTLLQQVYLGARDGISYAGLNESGVGAIVTSPGATPAGKLGRVSSASFPLGGNWPGAGSLTGTASFNVNLGHDAKTNPFVHTYHPDHDNWDARYENKLGAGVESYSVSRQITLAFNPLLPAGVSDLSWGITTIGGTYTEVITGLRTGEGISISGPFILHQVSEAATLTP